MIYEITFGQAFIDYLKIMNTLTSYLTYKTRSLSKEMNKITEVSKQEFSQKFNMMIKHFQWRWMSSGCCQRIKSFFSSFSLSSCGRRILVDTTVHNCCNSVKINYGLSPEKIILKSSFLYMKYLTKLNLMSYLHYIL